MTLRAILRRLGYWLTHDQDDVLTEATLTNIREKSARAQYLADMEIPSVSPLEPWMEDMVRQEDAAYTRRSSGKPGPSASRALSKPWDRGKA